MSENSTALESSNLKELEAHITEEKDPSKKLELTIHFMEGALAQAGTPHFKDFWEAKRLCHDLFKENISPAGRIYLWAKFSELCNEARKLKEIFDEESAFAVEQIEMAVKAVEDDITHLDSLLEQFGDFDFSISPRSLMQNLENYKRIQRELNLLNTFASRINALRKELIKTDMRIRDKNKLFGRLSLLGDAVFPKRKNLISEVSGCFSQDVTNFIDHTFAEDMAEGELFDLKEEIKALQNSAKEITLNTEVFSETRKRLSDCWDKLAKQIDEHKQQEMEQKAEFREHRDELVNQLQEIGTKFEASQINANEALNLIDELARKMRQTTLGRQEVHTLREKISSARKIYSDKLQAVQDAAMKAQAQKEKERLEFFKNLESSIDSLMAKIADTEIEPLQVAYDEIAKEVNDAALHRAEKLELDRKLHKARDLISEKREMKILNLSAGDKEQLGQLKMLLSEKKARQKEIKSSLEAMRKAKGTSGLAFAEALQAHDEVAQLKETYAKIEGAIGDIESRIYELEAGK